MIFKIINIYRDGGLMENNILDMNEKEANKLAAQITALTISFLVLVYILNVLGIFIVPQVPMTIAMGTATLLLLIPAFLVLFLKQYDAWVKYVIVTACTLMVSVTSLLLSWHVILLFIYPIAIASLYFSRKLSWYAVVLSLLLFFISQYGSLYMDGVADKNLKDAYSMIIYGIVPRSIELLALSLIFIRLSHRTKTLLQNVVGAQEQKETLNYIMTITDKSYQVANVLSKSVKELLEATGNAITTNENITKMTGNIVDDSKQTIRYVEEAGSVVSDIVSDLKLIADDNVKISDVSQETKRLTNSNTINMKNAAEGIRQIDDAAKKSKDIILKLGEKSYEIVNIAQIIKSIAESTSLLSLNASIESARAGEHGRGFAVVATEIRILAEQSQQAAGNIAELIQTVVADTMEAVNAIDYNAKLVEKGLALINKADQSSAEVSDSIQKVNAIATNAATLSSTVAKNGDKINSAVEGISKLTVESMERLKGILQSSEEQLKAVNEVAAFVEAIDTTSDELLSVVNKKL